MSMTRGEAIEYFKMKVSAREAIGNDIVTDYEAYKIALSALCPVSREQVEQVWGGMWIYDPDTGYAYCEMCKHTICQTDYLNGKLPPFCEMCGAPMTDEAVQMVMERLEALKDADN